MAGFLSWLWTEHGVAAALLLGLSGCAFIHLGLDAFRAGRKLKRRIDS